MAKDLKALRDLVHQQKLQELMKTEEHSEKEKALAKEVADLRETVNQTNQ